MTNVYLTLKLHKKVLIIKRKLNIFWIKCGFFCFSMLSYGAQLSRLRLYWTQREWCTSNRLVLVPPAPKSTPSRMSPEYRSGKKGELTREDESIFSLKIRKNSNIHCKIFNMIDTSSWFRFEWKMVHKDKQRLSVSPSSGIIQPNEMQVLVIF